MRLQTKLILIFLYLSFIPLAISAFVMVSTLNREVKERIAALQREEVEVVAYRMSWSLGQTARGLRQVFQTFDLKQLDDAQVQNVLRLAYRMYPLVNALVLTDEEGALLSAPVRLQSQEEAVEMGSRFPVPDSALAQLADPEFRGRVRAEGVSWTVGNTRAGLEIPHFLFGMELYKDAAGHSTMLMGLVSALEVGTFVSEFHARTSRNIYVLRMDQSVFLKSVGEKGGLLEGSPGEQPGIPHGVLDVLKGESGIAEYSAEDDQDRLVTYSRLGSLQLNLVSETETSVVTEQLSRLRQRIGYWLVVSGVIAVIFAVYFSNGLSRPIRALSEAALEIARGNYRQHVESRTRDEVGELAKSFNYMATELQSQQAEIARQSAEITEWNKELLVRVDDRTRELKEAQAYLVHTQKLAAVAELGSGVAHELNNPLAVVLGFVQILRSRHAQPGDPETNILQKVEENAQRCRDIVQHLLRFSQAQTSEGAAEFVDIDEVVKDVLKLFEGYFNGRKVTLKDELPPHLRVWGSRAQLMQATLQLMSAFRATVPPKSRILLKATEGPDRVSVEIHGSWEGLSQVQLEGGLGQVVSTTDKDQALSQGLGFWVAQKIFQDHRGSITLVRSEADTCLTLVLPRRAPEVGVLPGGNT